MRFFFQKNVGQRLKNTTTLLFTAVWASHLGVGQRWDKVKANQKVKGQKQKKTFETLHDAEPSGALFRPALCLAGNIDKDIICQAWLKD